MDVAFVLAILALYTLSDLSLRQAPGIEVFLIGAVIYTAYDDPLNTLIVILAFAWGYLPRRPNWLAWMAAVHPGALVCLLVGFGVRKGLIGRADLVALGGVACVLPWIGVFLALAGVEVWRRLVRKLRGGEGGIVPALPGMLLGVLVYQVAIFVVNSF